MEQCERDQRIVEEFSKRRHAQWTMTFLLVAVIALFMLLDGRPETSPVRLSGPMVNGAGFVCLAAAVTFSFRNWRCPACNQYLAKSINPSFCMKCGARLQ